MFSWRTHVPPIFAVGDILALPMLAHKAIHEGRVAAEVAAGHKVAFGARVIPREEFLRRLAQERETARRLF